MKKWLFLLGLSIGCGDVNQLDVALVFPDEATASQTEQLLFIAEAVSPSGATCAGLFSAEALPLPDMSRVLNYPNRSDLLLAPLDVGRYSAYVYALGGATDGLCDAGTPCAADLQCIPIMAGKSVCVDSAAPPVLAGGCSAVEITENEQGEAFVALEPPSDG